MLALRDKELHADACEQNMKCFQPGGGFENVKAHLTCSVCDMYVQPWQSFAAKPAPHTPLAATVVHVLSLARYG